MRFKAADRKRVTARYAPAGDHAPAVVLLHEIRGGPDQWDDLTGDLHAAGFATLAYLSRPSVMERERVADTRCCSCPTDRESASADSILEGAVRSTSIRSQRPRHGVVLLAEPGVRDALLRWLDDRVS